MYNSTTCVVSWSEEINSTTAWNEICVWVIEYFGLPGSKFTTHPTEKYMEFKFTSPHDADIFMLRWGHVAHVKRKDNERI
jgi:hypothetical protein